MAGKRKETWLHYEGGNVMKVKMIAFAGMSIAVMLLMGCSGPGRVAMDCGTSYKNAKFGQTLSPTAERNLEPVEGMDGQAAQNVVEKYRLSFTKGTTDSSASCGSSQGTLSTMPIGTPPAGAP